jgi:hypothetical protein
MRKRAYGPLVVALLVAIALLGSGLAPAHAGGRVFVGIGLGAPWVGAPFWYPWAYPYAYPYPVYTAPPVVVEASPPVYVQRQAAPPPQSYWYYCQESRTYYPYVKECPGGWLQVVPQTAPPAPGAPR